MPDEVLINGINQDGEIKSFYNLTEDENNITLIFKSEISFLNCMFRDCFQIDGVGLSQFDTTHVTETKMMFEGCTKLTSLNLNNFITSGVTSMSEMFRGCSSLKYLGLSSFERNNNLYLGFYGDINKYNAAIIKRATRSSIFTPQIVIWQNIIPEILSAIGDNRVSIVLSKFITKWYYK